MHLLCYIVRIIQFKPTQEVRSGYIIHECRAFHQAHFPLSSSEAFDDTDTHCLWDHSFLDIRICRDSAAYHTETSHHHTKKRIYRFIDNWDVDLGLLMVYWCRFAICAFCCFGCYVPVIVDITWVNGHKYLVAAIPFCFRAIPIAFRRFTDEEIRRCSSQNQIENDFFSWLRMTLWDHKVVIIADRGFRRTSLLQFLGGLGLDYVIRVCGNV